MGSKTQIIKVKNISISLTTIHDEKYICLTDIAKAKEGDSRAADIIKNWIRNRATLEFLGTWEKMYNPDFKVVEFDHFKMQAGLPSLPNHKLETVSRYLLGESYKIKEIKAEL